MLIKLGLSRRYRRNALRNRRSVLAISLIKLSTIIETLELQLRIENKRKIGNASKLFNAMKNTSKLKQEEMQPLEKIFK